MAFVILWPFLWRLMLRLRADERLGLGLTGWMSAACFLEFKSIWGFPKIRGTLFWGPYNKDPII